MSALRPRRRRRGAPLLAMPPMGRDPQAGGDRHGRQGAPREADRRAGADRPAPDGPRAPRHEP
eukprot:10249652-Lingulodinium_polyedra.AAC.1